MKILKNRQEFKHESLRNGMWVLSVYYDDILIFRLDSLGDWERNVYLKDSNKKTHKYIDSDGFEYIRITNNKGEICLYETNQTFIRIERDRAGIVKYKEVNGNISIYNNSDIVSINLDAVESDHIVRIVKV